MRSFFLPQEAVVILGIPISPSLPNDSRIWAWTSNGKFTVRSAYRVAVNVLQDEKGTSSVGDCSDASRMLSLLAVYMAA